MAHARLLWTEVTPGGTFLVMTHTCAKNQANQGGSCILGVSVLQKVTVSSVRARLLYSLSCIPKKNNAVRLAQLKENRSWFL